MLDVVTQFFSEHGWIEIGFCLVVFAVPVFWILAFVILIPYHLFLGMRRSMQRGARAFRGRDRAVSVPRHTLRLVRLGGLGTAAAAVVAAREIVEFAGILKRRHTPDPDLTRELGAWPGIYRNESGFLLKARHLDPKWARFPGKAASWTGGITGLLVLLDHPTGPGLIGCVVAGCATTSLSVKVWAGIVSSRLVVTVQPGVVSWSGGRHTGMVKGQASAGNWKIEVNPQHPLGSEELRLHTDAIRRGAIKPDAPYEPAYHNASRVGTQSGYMGRDWQAMAEIAGDREGRQAYRLQTAILFLHDRCETEAHVAQRMLQRDLVTRMR